MTRHGFTKCSVRLKVAGAFAALSILLALLCASAAATAAVQAPAAATVIDALQPAPGVATNSGSASAGAIVDADDHPTLGRDTVHNDHPTVGRNTIHNDHPTLGRNTVHNDHPAGRRSPVAYHFTAGQFPDHQHHIDDDQPVVWRFVGRRVGGWVCGSGGQSVVWSRGGHRVAGGGRPGGWVICDRRRVQQ